MPRKPMAPAWCDGRWRCTLCPGTCAECFEEGNELTRQGNSLLQITNQPTAPAPPRAGSLSTYLQPPNTATPCQLHSIYTLSHYSLSIPVYGIPVQLYSSIKNQSTESFCTVQYYTYRSVQYIPYRTVPYHAVLYIRTHTVRLYMY